MSETFKINFNSHFKSGWVIILAILISFNFPRIMALISPNEANEISVWIGVFIFVLFAVPAIIIHVNYFIINKGDVFIYFPHERKITFSHNGISTTFSLDDIDHIKLSISFNEAANRSGVVPWDGYNHSVIYLKTGDIFTITSLLVPHLDLPLEEKRRIIKRNIYRLAKIR